jgi:NADP-dependent 3-hydroxy acid dehydrogenase YdfG
MSKVWFVTGAGSGIGAATARAALKAGDRVVATGRHLDKIRNALSDVAGESLAFVQFDVTKEAQAKAAVGEAIKAFGRIDVLVNNAGYSLLGNFEELSTGEIEQLIATNFYGVMHAMRAVLPVMLGADHQCQFAGGHRRLQALRGLQRRKIRRRRPVGIGGPGG